MGIRSLLPLSLVLLALSFAVPVLADVPNPTTGSGGSTTTTSGTLGTGGSPFDPSCTVASAQVAGRTCQTCDPSSSCASLSSDYFLVCQSAANTAVYCNGPNGSTYQDQNVACSVSSPGAWGSVAGGLMLAVAGILARRRRRR